MLAPIEFLAPANISSMLLGARAVMSWRVWQLTMVKSERPCGVS